MSLHYPSIWFLLLLLVLPLIWWRRMRAPRRVAVAFSSVELMRQAGVPWAIRLRSIVPLLRGLALVLLIISIARPRKADERTQVFTDGIAIQLVLDRSGSMRAMDFQVDGKRADRLTAVKNVVEGFVSGVDDLPGRPNDLIGLITFASFADSISPLTLDQDYLVGAVRQTTVASETEGSGTALGDAVALGVERLHRLSDRKDLRSGDRQIKSRVMILLTDGESNAGEIDPITAAEMAAAFDIKIYTIGAGTDRGMAPIPVTDPFSGRQVLRNMPVSIDEETLDRIADITGGAYFRATDTDSLTDIYGRIDELEKTDIEQRRYSQYSELSLEPMRLGRFTLPALLPIVFVLLGLELVLAHTRFRTVP